MSIQVFISYKSEYREFAQKVRNQVQAWGHGTWFDMDNIPSGTYFRDAIEDGLDNSDVLLAVLTEEAQRSREVMAEIDYFLAQNKPLVPLKRGDFKLRYIFITIQWIDFTKDEASAFADLHTRLTQLVSNLSAPAAKPAPPPEAEPIRDGTFGAPGGAASSTEIADFLPARESEKAASPATSIASENIPAARPQSPPSGYAVPPMQAAPAVKSAGFFTTLRSKFRATPEDEAALDLTNRQRMLQKVHDFWVVGVLENALRESGSFDLGLSAAPGAVLKHMDYGDYPLPSSASIGDIFSDLNRELLILGAPGAGKTILLLQLASDLIERAKADPTLAMPVVFNLSGWASERKPLGDWLVDELRLKYQVPKRVAQKWVEGDQLTLLLDGLDEVTGQYRNDCVETINTYRHQHTAIDLAVCSRIADYDVLTSRLDLRGAITLQPLSSEQISSYIDRPELSALRDALAADTTLREMAATPFLLNTMAYAYQGTSAIDLKLPASADPAKARRTHLFEVYVKRVYERKGVSSPYPLDKVTHWLAKLAVMMTRQTKTMFYLSRIQPDWLPSNGLRWLCTILSIILSGICLGAAMWIAVGVALGTVAGVAAGLMIGLSAALSLTFAILRGMRVRFVMVEGVRTACVLALGYVLQLPFWAYLVLFVLLIVLFEISGKKRFKQEGEIETVDRLHFSGVQALTGLVIGGLIALTLGGNTLLLIPAFTLLASLSGTRKEVPTVTTPNQEIQQSFYSATQIGLLIGIVFALAFGAIAGLQYLPIWIVAAGIIVWFHYGGLAVMQHGILRVILWLAGSAPLNYARFLDYCASINLLRKVGGGYIYVHRYLLEYFAELNA